MKKYFPFFILVAALFMSITGSYFSVTGLGKFFGGHKIGATILAIGFELGSIIAATSLKFYWKFIPKQLKLFIIPMIVIITTLTSIGIYGYLSDGYQKTAIKDEIVTKRNDLIKTKKQVYEKRIEDNKNELSSINSNLEELTKSYNQNSQTQKMVNGQLVTNVYVTSKKGLDQQMNLLNERKLVLDSLNFSYQDSIQNFEIQIINNESNNEAASELGPLKYLSQLLNYPMNKIASWLILLIVIVFQPFALMLILLSMFAFKNNHYLTRKPRNKKNKNIPLNLEPEVKDESLNNEIQLENENKENEVQVKPKRKYTKRKKKEEALISETDVEEIKNKGVKRKVVNNNLTSNLADHIANSLQKNKKKV